MPQGRRWHLALEIAFACFLQRGLALGLLHAREPLRRLDLLLLLHRPAPLPRMRAWPDCRGTARAHGGGGASPRFGLAGLPRLAAAAPARSPRSARARAEQAVRSRVLRVVWYALQSYSPARDGSARWAVQGRAAAGGVASWWASHDAALLFFCRCLLEDRVRRLELRQRELRLTLLMAPTYGCDAAWAGIDRCRGRSIVPGLAIISSRLGHLRPGLTHYTQQRVRCAPFTYALRDRLERVDRLLDRNLAVQRRAPHGAVRSVALQRRRVLLPRTERHEMNRSETKPETGTAPVNAR